MLRMLTHQARCVPRLSFLQCSLLDPPQRKRGLLEQLNLSADTFETQRSILQGSPAARAPYMFVDTVLVGSADLAQELLMNDSGAYVVDRRTCCTSLGNTPWALYWSRSTCRWGAGSHISQRSCFRTSITGNGSLLSAPDVQLQTTHAANGELPPSQPPLN